MKRIFLWIVIAQLVLGPTQGWSKIKPKEGYEKVIIKKGDTLWDLAAIYMEDPFKWRDFMDFNEIDNPHLIYPGERLAIGKREAEDLLAMLKKEREEMKKALVEKDKVIDEKISNIYDMIIKMNLRIEDIKYFSRREGDLEMENIKLKKRADELTQEEEILKRLIDDLNAKIKELEGKLLESEMKNAKLIEENKRLEREKGEIKTFAYFLAAAGIAGLILVASYK